MRIIIDCDQRHWPAAAALAGRQMLNWRDRYARIGRGDNFGNRGEVRFFVRRIKDGFSVTQTDPERGTI